MTLVEAPTFYEAAVQGEPLRRSVFPPRLNMQELIWTIGDWPLRVPEAAPRSIPGLQGIIADTRGWTGWSARRLADIVGCSHTTIINAENGRPLVSGHSGDLRQRLVAIHDLVERVYVLADRDRERTGTLLDSALAGRRSAIDELRAGGDPGQAYLVALDLLRPRRTGLLVSDRPRRAGPTTALHE